MDFHAHSPASFDYGSSKEDEAGPGNVTFEAWLQTYMDAEVDVVIVTDHNSSEGIDLARECLHEMRQADKPTFRELSVIAGVEVTVASGTHLLAIFDDDTPSSVVSDLLVQADYAGVRGESTKAATKSLSEVARLIHRAGGLAIPAHATGPAGLFKQTGTGWAEVLAGAPIAALETAEPFAPGSPAASSKLVRVLGSDAHHLIADDCPPDVQPKVPGSHFTWIKMSLPNLAGIRNALTDGADSVIPSDEVKNDPRLFSHSWIRSIRFGQTELSFGPWMNSVIGGRGVGKSTAVETLRLALDKHHELPSTLKRDLSWFSPEPLAGKDDARVWQSGLDVSTAYEKDGAIFRIDWKSNSGHEISERMGEEWELSPGQVKSRFPARIYSQKQIYEMAVHPQALLQVVDSAPEVGIEHWRETYKILCDEYRAIVAEKQALQDKVSSEPRIQGEVSDLERKIRLSEDLEASDELKSLRKWESIRSATETWQSDLKGLTEGLRTAITGLTWPALQAPAGTPPEIESRLASSALAVSDARELLRSIVEKLVDEEHSLSGDVATWNLEVEVDAARKEVLKTAPDADISITSPLYQVAGWKSELNTRKRQLEELVDIKTRIFLLQEDASKKLTRIAQSRAELTERRQSVINSALQRVDTVQVKLIEQGYDEFLEREWRRLLQKESGFEVYFTREVLFSGLGNTRSRDYVKKDLPKLRERFTQIAKQGANYSWLANVKVDARLVGHIESLTDAQIAEFNLWFPEDKVEVVFRPAGSNNFKPVAEGSPGQKTAALLALVLSLGDEPLILDQPEDDLDNKLIYSLVVAMLRKIKSKRQVIVVTHNANIVVNGNSESVTVLQGSEPAMMQVAAGSLAEEHVRDAVCLIMEGGEEAFRRRFDRLQLN